MQEIRHFLIGNFLHFTAGVNTVIDTDVVVLLTTGEQVTGHFIRAFAFVLWISRDNKMVVINKAAVVYVQGLEQSKD